MDALWALTSAIGCIELTPPPTHLYRLMEITVLTTDGANYVYKYTQTIKQPCSMLQYSTEKLTSATSYIILCASCFRHSQSIPLYTMYPSAVVAMVTYKPI